MLVALLLLNLAGGEAVQSVEDLEQDEGLMAILRQAEVRGQGRALQALGARFQRERQRTLPSPSSVFRYLEAFGGEDEGQRAQGQGFIPQATVGLQGLRAVNTHLVAQVQRLRTHQTATLDMDATPMEGACSPCRFQLLGTYPGV